MSLEGQSAFRGRDRVAACIEPRDHQGMYALHVGATVSVLAVSVLACTDVRGGLCHRFIRKSPSGCSSVNMTAPLTVSVKLREHGCAVDNLQVPVMFAARSAGEHSRCANDNGTLML
eukprot:4234297-Amphidinium_carterae.2